MRNESPFPDNKTCSACVHKPCRRVLAGNIYPGKLTFVSRKDFVSLSCMHTLAQQEQQEEQEALTDNMEVVQGTVELTNPRWEHMDEGRQEDSPDSVILEDSVVLLVDIQNLPEGHSVVFDIYDTSSEPAQRIDTVKGTHESGVGKAEWVVKDIMGKGKKLKLAFDASAKSRVSDRVPIPVEFVTGYRFSM